MVSAGSGINPAHQFPIEERHEDDGCFCANTTPTSNLPKMNEDELHVRFLSGTAIIIVEHFLDGLSTLQR